MVGVDRAMDSERRAYPPPPSKVLFTAHLSFSIPFGWSQPIITGIDWSTYLSGIQPPSPFRILSHSPLFFPLPWYWSEEYIAGADWDMNIWVKCVPPFRLSFPRSSHFYPSVWPIRTNIPKRKNKRLGYRYLSGIHTLPSDFPLLISSPLLLGRSEDLIRWIDWNMDIWVTCVPTLQRFFPTAWLSSFNRVLHIWVSVSVPCVSLSGSRKHQCKNYWDIDTSAHSPSEFLSHRSSPFCLDDRRNWLQEWTQLEWTKI
jgi:hypothetical protein